MKSRDDMGPAQYGLMFGFYLVSYFVVIFFNSGLVTVANEVFAGRQASFKDGMRNATSHIGSIFVYALIAATVGMLLRLASERLGIIGSIILRILGFAWTLLTYFVAPILVLENKSPVAAIRESGNMLRKTWGENIVMNTGLNLVFTLLTFLAMIPLVGGIVLAVSGTVILGVATAFGALVFFVIICLISSTLTGVFQTALYVYARTGQLPNVYDPGMVEYAFQPRKQRGRSRF
jgi:hypothetical protein